jgi:hypothetical protein
MGEEKLYLNLSPLHDERCSRWPGDPAHRSLRRAVLLWRSGSEPASTRGVPDSSSTCQRLLSRAAERCIIVLASI